MRVEVMKYCGVGALGLVLAVGPLGCSGDDEETEEGVTAGETEDPAVPGDDAMGDAADPMGTMDDADAGGANDMGADDMGANDMGANDMGADNNQGLDENGDQMGEEAPGHTHGPGHNLPSHAGGPAGSDVGGAASAMAGGQRMYVNTWMLNVRSGPGMSHPVVNGLRKGDAVTARPVNHIWSKIDENQFVATRFLSPNPQ